MGDFISLSAAARAFGLNQGNLSSVLSGRFSQHKGFVVSLKDEEPAVTDEIRTDYGNKPCVGFSPEGKRHHFDSYISGARAACPGTENANGVTRSISSPDEKKSQTFGWTFFSPEEAPESLDGIQFIRRGRPR